MRQHDPSRCSAYQRLNKEIGALVGEFVSSGDEEVKCLVEIEVVMSVKMPADEVVDLILGHGVKILRGEKTTTTMIKHDRSIFVSPFLLPVHMKSRVSVQWTIRLPEFYHFYQNC